MRSLPGVTANPVEVPTGEVKAASQGMLRASAIGSCVAVALYHAEAGAGGIAHVMLPGRSPFREPDRRTRYAEVAVEELMREMAALGATADGASACLVGGANVLGDGHPSPGPEIAASLIAILGRHGIVPVATDLGGTERRSCSLDVALGRVTYTVGNSERRTLWAAQEESSR